VAAGLTLVLRATGHDDRADETRASDYDELGEAATLAPREPAPALAPER
jgi:hypothetical protein